MSENKKQTQFDPDFTPDNPHNQEAAKKAGVKFDKRKGSYVDEDGCMIFDRFGQPY